MPTKHPRLGWPTGGLPRKGVLHGGEGPRIGGSSHIGSRNRGPGRAPSPLEPDVLLVALHDVFGYAGVLEDGR